MKRILLILVLVCAMLTTSAYFVCLAMPNALFGNNSKFKGSGNIISRTMDAPAFHEVEAARAVKVVISDKITDKITVEADDNIMEYVVVKAKDGTLYATIDKKLRSVSNANITVTIPANGRIRSLEASSAAKITSDVMLTAEEFSIEASSAAKIEATVKASKCEIEASSSAKILATVEAVNCEVEASSAASITLKGSASKCDIELSSAAKLTADDFVVVDCKVEASSAAKASVNCTGHLRANASSAGSVNYKGDCSTTISKSSGGSVRQK